MADTKIFVCCHGKNLMPIEYSQPPFVLIGGGGYRSEFIKLADDTGDSIWEYNRYLNEATVLYWVANNYRPLPDFVGTAMYRHRLELSEGEPGTILCCGVGIGRSVRAQYNAHHVGLDMLLSEVKRCMPDHYADFVEYLDTSRVLYRGNMFIMPRADFIEYALFLNRCVRMLIPMVDKLGLRESGDPRTCGFMMERLTAYWMWQRARAGFVEQKSLRMLHYSLPQVPLSRTPGRA